MNNPFSKPYTTEEWLLSSVCWTVSCFGGWWCSGHAVAQRFGEDYLIYASPLCLLTANWLLCRYVLVRGWKIIGWYDTATSLWLKLVAYVWFSMLAGFQLLCLLFFLWILTWLL